MEEWFERQMRVYLEQAKQSRKLRETIARQMEWFRRAHRDAEKNTETWASDVFYRHRAEKLAGRARATIRRLERLEAERVDRPQADPAIRLQLRSDGKSGRRVVAASDVSKFFDGRCVFSGASFAVMRGDRQEGVVADFPAMAAPHAAIVAAERAGADRRYRSCLPATVPAVRARSRDHAYEGRVLRNCFGGPRSQLQLLATGEGPRCDGRLP
ncbi:MAG: macrolide transport system ATP-binding/permease protein [Bacillota bacterium]|nr:macrolide transport system ATP-binding/permease protein [Bacillota bacterium]